MSPAIILCPGGSESQTGTAVGKRYPGISIERCGENIKAVADHLESGGNGPYVVPIWNSHQGEVPAAEYVWDYIQKALIKVIDVWPGSIEFWFIRRVGNSTNYGKIGSVSVARPQCSAFLAKQKAELIPCALTTVAHEEYRKGASWDGVLVAPGQGEHEAGYEVAEKKTANPNNFTSFMHFVPTREFKSNAPAIKSWLTGVTMPSFGTSLGEIEQSFFEELISPATDLINIPKLIFVLKRTAKVGLLFEGTQLHAGDLLDVEEEESGDILIYEDAGAMTNFYTNELQDLFTKEFPDLQSEDFILHHGVNSCLFACPPLGLYTHGYEIETVKPVVRFYISKLFQRLDDGAKCTQTQSDFFQRHKNAWEEKGSEFIQFKVIGPTGLEDNGVRP